ncbi:MAG: 50S ribosomal protein L19 [Chitinispirillaceae bacterium]|nr:50S ribosomal protein L19 [Chitinispirillaceae bacterium]
MSEIIKAVERKRFVKRKVVYTPGDTITVSLRIKEGDKERVQQFQGTVIQTRGTGLGKTVTVRKSSGNVYVERVFPVNSPLISDIKLLRRGRVRRARLFYLRSRTGKSTRIQKQK